MMKIKGFFERKRLCQHDFGWTRISNLLYIYYIILLVRHPSNLNGWLIILKDFYFSMGMIVNTNETNIAIIKSKKNQLC